MANKSMEIVQAISQAIHNKHHGSGEEIGLRRENKESNVILDGFGVKFSGDELTIVYNSEENIENAHDPKFESIVEETVDNVASYIKKEYKKYGKGNLTLKPVGEIMVDGTTVNRRTLKVIAKKTYKIGKLEETEELVQPSEKSKETEKLEKALQEFRKLSPSNKLYGK